MAVTQSVAVVLGALLRRRPPPWPPGTPRAPPFENGDSSISALLFSAEDCPLRNWHSRSRSIARCRCWFTGARPIGISVIGENGGSNVVDDTDPYATKFVISDSVVVGQLIESCRTAFLTRRTTADSLAVCLRADMEEERRVSGPERGLEADTTSENQARMANPAFRLNQQWPPSVPR